MDGRLSHHLQEKTVNVIIGVVGMLIFLRAQKSHDGIKKTQRRMMVATFSGKPSTMIISINSLNLSQWWNEPRHL